MNRRRLPALGTLAAAVAAAVTGGCSSYQSYQESRVTLTEQWFGAPQAVALARLAPVGGSRVEGSVGFYQYGAFVVVRANFLGLAANRDYGLHVHEGRNCADIGGHFNPRGTPHGRFDQDARHAGDLPNVRAEGEASTMYAFQAGALTVTEGRNSVIGRTIVLSRDPDDYRTQPDGASGPPLACGFIRPG